MPCCDDDHNSCAMTTWFNYLRPVSVSIFLNFLQLSSTAATTSALCPPSNCCVPPPCLLRNRQPGQVGIFNLLLWAHQHRNIDSSQHQSPLTWAPSVSVPTEDEPPSTLVRCLEVHLLLHSYCESDSYLTAHFAYPIERAAHLPL